MSSAMTSKTPDTIWWDNITGPSRFLEETVSLLRDGKSVCICTGDQLPYRETFFRQVANELRENEESLLFEDMAETDGDPGMYLIDRYDIRAGYRETMRPADFLNKSGVLLNRLIPVASRGDGARKWYEFIGLYKSSSLKDGLFVMEAIGFTPRNNSNSICVLKYSDFVSEYDYMLFAGLITSREVSSAKVKRYITALAVSMFGGDAESISAFCRDYNIKCDPISYMCADNLDNTMILRCIWNSQIQELFPFIMRETREFIDKWRVQIDEAIEYIKSSREFKSGLIHNGLRSIIEESIEAPVEMEPAAVYFLMRKRRLDTSGNETSDYVLYIPDEDARLRMKLLYDARNKIAHGKICEVEEVLQLLRYE